LIPECDSTLTVDVRIRSTTRLFAPIWGRASHSEGWYYAAIAEKADADEHANKLANRQRKAFNRALEGMLDAELLVAREIEGRRTLWLP
jgi:hypothetical protein